MTLPMVLLVACSDTGFAVKAPGVDDATPHIEVSPTALDFWSADRGETATLSFTIWSTGDALLSVDDLTLTGSESFALPDASAMDLAPGESREVEVSFTPMEPGDQVGEVLVASNDPDQPEIPVALSGDGNVPSLVITPDPWDFGAIPVGCMEDVTLTLQNVGSEDLTIDSWAYVGDGLSLTPGTSPPIVLAPYDYTEVSVTFEPNAAGNFAGTFSVSSDDPRGVVSATQSGEGTDATPVTETFETEADPPVDILIAVDQSASMDDDAAALGAAFSSFIDTIATVTSDWHLGVVTLDEGCFNGGVLTTGTADLAATFAEAVSLGDDIDIVHDEALLQLADAALAETSGCNTGFLRSDALLHVIVVSDEPERSTEEAAAWTWDHWVDRYYGYVSDPTHLLVSGVVDTDGCNEGDDGYAEAIAATGGEHLSICAGDWADRMATLASASVASLWTFALAETPVPESITVTVDGVTMTTGWSYDAEANAIVVDTLEAGATVEVTYERIGECE